MDAIVARASTLLKAQKKKGAAEAAPSLRSVEHSLASLSYSYRIRSAVSMASRTKESVIRARAAVSSAV